MNIPGPKSPFYAKECRRDITFPISILREAYCWLWYYLGGTCFQDLRTHPKNDPHRVRPMFQWATIIWLIFNFQSIQYFPWNSLLTFILGYWLLMQTRGGLAQPKPVQLGLLMENFFDSREMHRMGFKILKLLDYNLTISNQTLADCGGVSLLLGCSKNGMAISTRRRVKQNPINLLSSTDWIFHRLKPWISLQHPFMGLTNHPSRCLGQNLTIICLPLFFWNSRYDRRICRGKPSRKSSD